MEKENRTGLRTDPGEPGLLTLLTPARRSSAFPNTGLARMLVTSIWDGPRTHEFADAQREGATWIGSVAKWRLAPVTSNNRIAVLLHYDNTPHCCDTLSLVLLLE